MSNFEHNAVIAFIKTSDLHIRWKALSFLTRKLKDAFLERLHAIQCSKKRRRTGRDEQAYTQETRQQASAQESRCQRFSNSSEGFNVLVEAALASNPMTDSTTLTTYPQPANFTYAQGGGQSQFESTTHGSSEDQGSGAFTDLRRADSAAMFTDDDITRCSKQ
jgi:hypothetical protein